MITHSDELQQAKFHVPARGTPNINELSHLEDAASRIHQKLLELREEYDEKIRTCATVIDGMALAAQLEWNKIGRNDTKTNLEISKSSLDIAEATKRDGQRMRSIAVLTMFFLPATFVATVFSMTFFNWTPGQGEEVLSPYIWVYVVGTAIFTGLTMGLWYIYSRRHEEGSDANGVPQKLGKE
ncbi:hypothetical protein VP1G_09784 [Cytospora mali]|uniref:Magnesium transport protein CorA n=1 Tax=Cytospora mali TaxID=578113 RepID=A0A194VFW9_CYTMA|nr:hypothetical protein VP1G_09784 [Valsa mali var. pyri (nom. inval.)]